MLISLDIFKNKATIKSKELEDKMPILKLQYNNFEIKLLQTLNKSLTNLEIQELKNIISIELRKNNSHLLKLMHYYFITGDYYTMVEQFKHYFNGNMENLNNLPNSFLESLIPLSMLDFSLPKLTFTEETFELNFEFGLFDILNINTLNILEDILQTSKNSKNNKSKKKDYIDRDLWEEYRIKNKLETITIEKATSLVQYTDSLKDRYKSNISIIKCNQEDFDYDEFVYSFEGNCFYEEQLLYVFISMLFEDHKHFVIKKCEHCNKFFITTHSNTKFCKRLQEDGLTYEEQLSKYRNSYKYSNLIQNMEDDIDKRMRESCDSGYFEKYDEYLENKRKAKKNGTIFEFLNSFYKPNTQKKHIKQLEEEKQKTIK